MSEVSTAAPAASGCAPSTHAFGADHLTDPLSGPAIQASGGSLGAGIESTARQGVQGSGGSLPFLDTIQASFGTHDVSGVRAHTGAQASGAAESIGARAYATGSDVAFRDAPDLHTAAHEAAHVIQQQSGVQLAGGVGAVGDRYERHADAVADAVVAGQSAQSLLDPFASSGGLSAGGPVQMLTDVFSAAHFADPVSYLKTRDGSGDNKVVEEPGSQGVLGVPDMILIETLAKKKGRERLSKAIDHQLNSLVTQKGIADQAERDASSDDQPARAAEAAAIAKKIQLWTALTTDFDTIEDKETAAIWYRQNTLTLGKLNRLPKKEHNAGSGQGKKTWDFHKDAGLLKVKAEDLHGGDDAAAAKADVLNGPAGNGFVRGHENILNMKHRFLEHIHVNKGKPDAIDIYKATSQEGEAAEAHLEAVQGLELHGTDKQAVKDVVAAKNKEDTDSLKPDED